MRVFTTLLATLASLAVVSATTDAADTLPAHVDLAAVASPGEDIPSADSNSFVVGQRSLEKRTLCAKDSDCNLVAHVLPLLYPNGAQCVKWLCVPKCGDLWDWDIFSHKCRDVSSDNENCGKCGQKCELDGASETTCRQGRCIATCCKPGYSLGDGVCHLNPSQQAYPHHKRSKVEPRKKLCPEANESACPILGSSTYGEAVKHLAHAGNQLSGVMLGAGGYECIDTTQALDSCGGCASTGEGVDCTKIRGARSVGCENSACRVFSCQAGFKPSPRGDKCVRARASAGIAKNATAHAAHKGLAAVRGAHS